MKRLFQLLLAAIGILGVVVVAAVVYVTTFLDPEDLKPRLVEVVRENSGLELELDGPLTWSFYPRVGVSVSHVEGRLPDQGDEAPFLAFDRAEVSLSFATLLRGEVAIEGIMLDGLKLRLERNEEGRGNWEALLERLEVHRDKAESAMSPASAGLNPVGGSNLTVALNIASVQVRNGEVWFRDLEAEREWLLEAVSLTGTNVNPRSAFPFKASFRLATHGDLDWRELERTPGLSSDMALETRARLVIPERRYVLEDFTLETTTRGAAFDQEQTANLTGKTLAVDLVAQQLTLIGGQMKGTLRHAGVGDAPLALNLGFALDADLAEQTAQLRDLALTGPDELRLTGNLNVSELLDAPTYSGQLKLAPLSLRPWLTRLGQEPVTSDPEALSEVALTSPVSGDLSQVTLNGLTLLMDDATFTGQLTAGFDGQRLVAGLQGDALDLDAYLPAESGEATAQHSGFFGISRAHAQEESSLVPAEWLAALTLDAELNLDRLGLMGLDATQVELALAGRDGRQRLERLTAQLYDGSLSANGELDLTREPIHWQVIPEVSRVRLEPLYQALSEDDGQAPLRGRLTLGGELVSSGNDGATLRRRLNGQLNGHIDEGAILDVNVSRELCTLAATLEGRETSRDWSDDTRFERAELSLEIRDGVARSDDIRVTLPGIEVGGEGELDLTTDRFDLRAATRFVDTADAACQVNPRLSRVPMPVRCSGSYTGDSSEWCRFDREAFQSSLAELVREEAGQRVEAEVEERLGGRVDELDERIGEEAGKELRDALRGLFN